MPRRETQSRGRSERNHRNRREPARQQAGGNNALIAGSVVIIVGVIGGIMISSSGDDPSTPDPKPSGLLSQETGSSSAGRSNAGRVKSNPPSTTPPAYTGSVDREPWDRISACMSEAYALKRKALRLREQGKEAEFVVEIKNSLKEFREAQQIYFDWVEGVEELQEGLWDRRFKKENKKFARFTKEMRAYFQWERK